ncbi:MAG: NAD-dependent epimerase/dehydratase family protein [Myxococcales bacterium]|nr:NAD-dependent epimerase/dehydratase family protein [Myxococcales bacterium]
MNTLIIGGTGHIGAAMARAVEARGWPVSVMSRRRILPTSLAGTTAVLVHGDGHDEADLARAIAGSSLVIDAAAPYPLRPETPENQRALVNKARARASAICQACRTSGAVLISVGSFVTHRTARGPLSPLLRRMHPYFAVKEAVQEVLLTASNHGLDVGILNPTGCLGPWDQKSRDLALIPTVAAGRLPGTVRDVVNFVDVRDVAAMALRLVDTERFGRPILVAGHNVPCPDICQQILALTGRKSRLLALPATVGAISLWSLEWALTPLGRRPPWPSLALFIMAQCGTVEPSADQLALGVPLRALSETLEDSVTWYRDIGYL